jgi:hypothetical protein
MRVCGYCGESIDHRQVSALYCNRIHANRAEKARWWRRRVLTRLRPRPRPPRPRPPLVCAMPGCTEIATSVPGQGRTRLYCSAVCRRKHETIKKQEIRDDAMRYRLLMEATHDHR